MLLLRLRRRRLRDCDCGSHCHYHSDCGDDDYHSYTTLLIAILPLLLNFPLAEPRVKEAATAGAFLQHRETSLEALFYQFGSLTGCFILKVSMGGVLTEF